MAKQPKSDPFVMVPNALIDEFGYGENLLWWIRLVRGRNYETNELSMGIKGLMRETGWGADRSRRIISAVKDQYPSSTLAVPLAVPSKLGQGRLSEAGPVPPAVRDQYPSSTHIQEEEKEDQEKSKKEQRTRVFPPGVEPELVDAFWKVKKGSKSDRAWALLVTNLFKIHEAGGDVNDQLQRGENAKWYGIDFRNWQRFAGSSGNGSDQPTRKSAAQLRRERLDEMLNSNLPDRPGVSPENEEDVPY